MNRLFYTAANFALVAVGGALIAYATFARPDTPPVMATDTAPMLHPALLRVSGPDQFGVVCYSFADRAISCVHAPQAPASSVR